MNIESNPYHLNEFMLGSLYQFITSDSVIKAPGYTNDQDTLDMLKYCAAQLYNKDNAEFHPTMENVDYMSVHTFR
jgi:thioredoxin-related protein